MIIQLRQFDVGRRTLEFRMVRHFYWVMLITILVLSGCQTSSSQAGVEIHDIQGCDHTSPMLGEKVIEVKGIVTLKMDNGFVMQSSTPDEQKCSSEAIFVLTEDFSGVITGDLVSVNGTVSEFTPGNEEQKNLSQTEITNAVIKVISSKNPFPDAVVMGADGYAFPKRIIEDDQLTAFDTENDGLDYFESLEWMRVKLPGLVVVGPRNTFNEIIVSEIDSDGTAEKREDFAKVATLYDMHPERLMLELPGTWRKAVNIGDLIDEGVIGILEYSFGNYKVYPVTKINLTKYVGTPSSSTGEKFPNGLRIANYNIHNFSQYTDSSKIKMLARQIASDLNSPDLLVLQEVMDDSGTEDNGETSAQQNLDVLTKAIKRAGGHDYMYFDFPPVNNQSGGITGGNIRTIFLLKTSSELKLTSVIGAEDGELKEQFINGNKVSFSPNPGQLGFDQWAFDNSRKPIAGVFDYHGKQIVIIGLHLVSRSMNSPLYGSDQPLSEPEIEKRLAQANAVNDWVENIRGKSPETFIIVAGDMNDGYEGAAVSLLMGSSLWDTADKIDEGSRFSFVHDGLGQLYDHILVSKNVEIEQVQVSHLNIMLDENAQVSDHDPIMVTLRIQ